MFRVPFQMFRVCFGLFRFVYGLFTVCLWFLFTVATRLRRCSPPPRRRPLRRRVRSSHVPARLGLEHLSKDRTAPYAHLQTCETPKTSHKAPCVWYLNRSSCSTSSCNRIFGAKSPEPVLKIIALKLRALRNMLFSLRYAGPPPPLLVHKS